MREFNFRAWDERNKIMHYSFQFIESLPSEENGCLIFTSDKQLVTTEWINNPYFRQQLKIMQYTGLKDKNGKEIYEGDVVGRDDMAYTRKVVYCPKRAAFILKDENETYFNMAFAYIVLGNIYENPELMEKKE